MQGCMSDAQLRVLIDIRRTDNVVKYHVESFSPGRLFVWTQDGSEAQVRPDGSTLWVESVEREENRAYSEYLRTGNYPSTDRVIA